MDHTCRISNLLLKTASSNYVWFLRFRGDRRTDRQTDGQTDRSFYLDDVITWFHQVIRIRSICLEGRRPAILITNESNDAVILYNLMTCVLLYIDCLDIPDPKCTKYLRLYRTHGIAISTHCIGINSVNVSRN